MNQSKDKPNTNEYVDGNVIYDNAGADQIQIIENIREQWKKLNLANRNQVKLLLEDETIISSPTAGASASIYPALDDGNSFEDVGKFDRYFYIYILFWGVAF